MSKYESRNNNGRSLFGPLMLVAIGAFFLLRNMGTLPNANWGVLFQLWPLALVFVGLNLVVQQAPRPVGRVLSALLGLVAVFTAVYILFFSEDNAFLNRLGVQTSPPELQSQEISFDPDDISSAQVELNFGIVGGEIYALERSQGLIEGTVFFVDDLIFEATEENNGEASVMLETKEGLFEQPWWGDSVEDRTWRIGLNPRIPLDLQINAGLGQVELNLDALTLSHLSINMDAGSSTVTLPDGTYEIEFDADLGASTIVFPENGRISAQIDGSAGSFNITIPDGIPARIEISSGLGGINMDERFSLVDGERNDDGIWETADFDSDGEEWLDLFIDMGTGSVQVSER